MDLCRLLRVDPPMDLCRLLDVDTPATAVSTTRWVGVWGDARMQRVH